MTIHNNSSSFFVENSRPCDTACRLIHEFGEQVNLNATEALRHALDRENALNFGREVTPASSFGLS